jgi:hypothetical protein
MEDVQGNNNQKQDINMAHDPYSPKDSRRWKAALARDLKRMSPRPVRTVVVETTSPETGKVIGTKTKKRSLSNADINEIIHAVYITQEAVDNYRTPRAPRETIVSDPADSQPTVVVEKIKRTTPKMKEA